MRTRQVIYAIVAIVLAPLGLVQSAIAQAESTHGIERLMRELQMRRMIVGVMENGNRVFTPYSWPEADYNGEGVCDPGWFPEDGFYSYAINNEPSYTPLEVLAAIANDNDCQLRARFLKGAVEFLQKEATLENTATSEVFHGYDYINGATETSLNLLDRYESWHFLGVDGAPSSLYVPTTIDDTNIVDALGTMLEAIGNCRYQRYSSTGMDDGEVEGAWWEPDPSGSLEGVGESASGWFNAFVPGSGEGWDPAENTQAASGVRQTGSDKWVFAIQEWAVDGSPPSWEANRRKYSPFWYWPVTTELEIFGYVALVNDFGCEGVPEYTAGAPFDAGAWSLFDTLSVVPPQSESDGAPITRWNNNFGGSGTSSDFDVGALATCLIGDPATSRMYDFSGGWELSAEGIWVFEFSPPVSGPCDPDDQTVPWTIDDGLGDGQQGRESGYGTDGGGSCGAPGAPGTGEGVGGGMAKPQPGFPFGGESGAPSPPDRGGRICLDVFPPTPGCGGRFQTDEPVEFRNGFKYEQATDLTVAVDGADYSLIRHYTGAPGYVSNTNRANNGPSLVGEGWSMSAFMYLSIQDLGDTLALRSWPATMEYVFSKTEADWPPVGASPEGIKKSFAMIDGEYWPTWELSNPGQWSMHFVRTMETSGFDSGKTAAARYGTYMVGHLLLSTDLYGQKRTYSYYRVQYTIGEQNYYVARLRAIHLNGSPQHFGDADIRFRWLLADDTPESIGGQLDDVRVIRRDAAGAEVVTQRVDYVYGAEFDQAGELSADVADNGTNHDESTELVQVVKYTLVDDAPTGVDPYRVQVTQYRYHDESTSSTGDERLDAYGLRSQLKSVIMPEQIEYYAEHRTSTGWAAGERVLKAAEELLSMDDDDDVPTNWDGPTSPIIVDFAAKVVDYTTTGLVNKQFIQSSCGCGGSGQSLRLTYQLEEYTVGANDDRGRSLIVTVAADEGSGFTDYKRQYYDVTYLNDIVPMLTSQATAEIGGQDPPVWAEVFEYNTTSLRPVTYIGPSAVTGYTNNPTDQLPPDIATSDTSGFVGVATYNSDGFPIEVSRGKGTSGTPEKLYTISYGTGGTASFPTKVEQYSVASSPTADEILTLNVSYLFHQQYDYDSSQVEDSIAISAITIESEAELPAENGQAGLTEGFKTIQLFDREGHLRWVRHPDGSLDYFDYDPSTGRATTIARNVDPTGAAAGSPNPALHGGEYGIADTSGWGRFADGGFSISTSEYDPMGRLVSSTSPSGVVSHLVRDIAAEDSSEFGTGGSDVLYYRTLRFPHMLADSSVDGPVSVSWQDAGDKTLRSSGFGVDAQGSYDPPTPADVDWDAELSRSTASVSYAGLVMSSKRWLDLDETGRVSETEFTYDGLGRRTMVTDANGTVRRTVFDVLDRPIESWIGDGPLEDDQVRVQELFYDSGTQEDRTNAGDSNLTVVVQHTGEDGTLSADERTTINYYDWRNRLVASQTPLEPYQVVQYDNMDRVTASAVFSALPTITSDRAYIEESDDRGAYSETLYSQRGLPYRSRVAIDPSQTTLTYLVSDTWYDESGRRVASQSPNAPASVVEYDGLGRTVRTFVTDRAGDTAFNGSGSYEDITDISDDIVIEESTVAFRDDTLPELAYTTQRTHDDTTAGEIGLDDGITTFAGSVYDDASRLIATINWGTNADGFEPAGSSGVPTVPSTVPDRDTSPWDETIITEQSYNSRGLTEIVTDPEGKETRYLYDDANRRVALVENYVSTSFGFGWDATAGRWEVTGGLSGSTPDVNRVTSYTHDLAGNVKYQVAHLPPSGAGSEDVQVTEYVYGVTAVTSSPDDTDSLITSYSLLKEARYPNESTGEPGTTDEYKVQYAYNRLGELRAVTDQNGTIHTYYRDTLGRPTKDWVTAFGTDVDGQGTDIDDAVKGIQIAYDSFGRVTEVESLNSTPSVVNGVEFGYNSLWQVTDVYQDPYGEVTQSSGTPTGDTEVVRYSYSASASANHSRITGMTYPDGSLLEYAYGSTSGDTDDLISRVTTLSIGPDTNNQTDIVVYDHIGLGMFAEVDYAVPDIQLDRTASHDGKRLTQDFTTQTAGLYPAYDRFGRVIRHTWIDGDYTQHSSTSGYPDRPSLFETTHSYDRSSNRLTRYDERPGAQMPNWDFEYEYDDLDRLTGADRGDWNGSTLTSGIGVQQWTLDMLGNWDTWNHDRNGDGDFSDSQEVEDRDHNAANEITSLDIQSLTGSPFTQYRDKAGNWTRNRRSAVSNIEYTHDAWNRLVKVRQLGTYPVSTLGTYQYNGLHWRTSKQFPHSGNTEERQLFYSASWQLLEERIDSDNSGGFAEEKCAQTVWGLRYIDDAVLRRTDTDQDYNYADTGERADYYLTDPQFSVVALVSDAGALQERAAYSAYGEARHHFPADMDADGDVDPTDIGWFTSANFKDIDEAGYNPDGDLNRDGTVNSSDLMLTFAWYGKAALAKGLISDPAGPGSPIGYDGYLFNAETKLYTVRYRHYEPVTGRWMERDPASYVDGLLLFQYARSAPLHFTDSNGREPEEPDANGDILPGLDQSSCGLNACRDKCARDHGKTGGDMFDCIKKCRTDAEKFTKWYNSERDISWTKDLPPCPCKNIKCAQANSTWEAPTEELHGYHRGASYCMRSKPVNGHANQCCYDHNGNLITHGSGSGSADKVPGTIGTYPGHKKHDMDPADLARKLDGGAWGCWSARYLDVRPQVGSERCSKNPDYDYPDWPSSAE